MHWQAATYGSLEWRRSAERPSEPPSTSKSGGKSAGASRTAGFGTAKTVRGAVSFGHVGAGAPPTATATSALVPPSWGEAESLTTTSAQ